MTSLRPDHVLLTLLSGESRCTSRVLRWGVAAPALTIGARAEWEVRAPGVDGVHVRLSFDGCRLRAAAVSASGARLQGRELGGDLCDVPFPFELAFGSARLSGHVVGSTAGSVTACAERAATRAPLAWPTLALIDPMETGHLDLASLTQAALMARPILAVGAPAPESSSSSSSTSQREPSAAASAPRPVEGSLPPREVASRAPARFQVVTGSTLTWSLGSLLAAPPRGPSAAPQTPAPGAAAWVPSHDTLCDGGALRDYARHLLEASLTGPQLLATPSPPEERATTRGPSAKRRARRTERAETARPLGSAPGALLARWKRTRESLLGLPRRRQWAAIPVAAALLLAGWSLLAMPGRAANSDAPSQPDAPLARQARATPPEPSAAPASASNAPLSQASTSLGGDTAGSAGAARPDPSPTAAPEPPLQGAAHSDAKARHGVTAALELTEPSPVTPSSRELFSSLALDAFRAAHAGNTARAVALYQKLARERSEPIYQHAARAVADNRVATP